MGYTYRINKKDKVLDFCYYVAPGETEEREIEETEDGKKPKLITKLQMIRLFLREHKLFYTVQEVSDLLKVKRITIQKMLNEKRLPTYDINYYKALFDDCDERSKWVSISPSNLQKVISVDDLKVFLKSIIKESFTYQVAEGSVVNGGEDLFNRHSPRILSMPFMVYTQRKHTKKQIDELVDKLLNHELMLHSKASLQPRIGKSDQTFTRLLKCTDTVRLNWGSQKDTTRLVLPCGVDDDGNVMEGEADMKALIEVKRLSTYCLSIVPIKRKEPLTVMDFENPVEFYSARMNGYKGDPDGIWYDEENKLMFFAIEDEENVFGGVKLT